MTAHPGVQTATFPGAHHGPGPGGQPPGAGLQREDPEVVGTMARATPLPCVSENEGPGSPQSGACRPCFLLSRPLCTPAAAV